MLSRSPGAGPDHRQGDRPPNPEPDVEPRGGGDDRHSTGSIRVRDLLELGTGEQNKVKAIEVFGQGSSAPSAAFAAGAVAKVWGLSDSRIGDRIWEGDSDRTAYQFPPPTLESVVARRDPADRGRLLDALAQLAEQDPLINVR